MNWLHAFRWCGGTLSANAIQQVRDALDELGYETEANDGGSGWITRLCRGTHLLWTSSMRGTDRQKQLAVIAALGSDHSNLLSARFGPYYLLMEDDEEDEEEIEYDDSEDIPINPKPFVGAATKLPLPK